MQDKTRYDFLDWLRVIAIFVLLFFHTGMLFVGWGWHIQNADTIGMLAWPMDIAHRLRMPLLFVVAGAGMWFALNRRSGAQLVGERSVRLLLPLVAGMFLIVPPQVYFERIFHGQWNGGYVSFLFERVFEFHPYPSGDFSWHHLWFIAYLYVYALLLLPFMLWWKRHRPQLRPGMWVFALGIPLSVNEALLRPIFPETHNLVADWYLFVHYLLFTTYGFVLASLPGTWDWLADQRRRSLISTVALLASATVLYERGDHSSGRSARFICRQHLYLAVPDGVPGLWTAVPVVRERAAPLGAGRQLSDLHPPSDRHHRHWLLRDSAALERREQVLDCADRDDGLVRRAL